MISVRNPANVEINATTVDEYVADDDGAVMYNNADTPQTSIEPAADRDVNEGAYTLSKTDSGASIPPWAFLETYDLEPAVTTQCTPRDGERGFIAIDLDAPSGSNGAPDEDP